MQPVYSIDSRQCELSIDKYVKFIVRYCRLVPQRTQEARRVNNVSHSNPVNGCTILLFKAAPWFGWALTVVGGSLCYPFAVISIPGKNNRLPPRAADSCRQLLMPFRSASGQKLGTSLALCLYLWFYCTGWYAVTQSGSKERAEMRNSRLVYSTETGRHCPDCGRSVKQCSCRKGKSTVASKPAADGIIRIRREVKGRKGKCVTTLSGFDVEQTDLKQLAAMLKRSCGTGGSVKGDCIIIQGDHRPALQNALLKAGFKVKLAGG